MGSDCQQEQNQPNYTNPCTENDYIGQKHTIPGLCTDENEANPECNKISSEWGKYSTAGCNCYDWSITCSRRSFDGDPATCCLQNYQASKNLSDCFSDSDRKKTCDPNYRSPTRTGCRGLFTSRCVNSANLYSAWTQDGFCYDILENNIYNSNGEINSEGLIWAQGQMENLLEKYFQNGIQPVGSAEPFQGYLYNVCSELPAACYPGLNSICSGYTREAASGNPNVGRFCGCHMISSVYAVYANQYGISKECDPICSRSDTIQSVNSEGQIEKCRSNICIIDDVTLNLVDTDVGNINFTQACGGCSGTASCQCTIAGLSINTVEAGLGNINLEQYCVGSLSCYRENPDNPNGPAIEVSCDLPDDYIPEAEAPIESSEGVRTTVIILLAVFGAIVVILGIVLLLVSIRKEPDPIIQNEYILSSPENEPSDGGSSS